jgi:hypothetical protein
MWFSTGFKDCLIDSILRYLMGSTVEFIKFEVDSDRDEFEGRKWGLPSAKHIDFGFYSRGKIARPFKCGNR